MIEQISDSAVKRAVSRKILEALHDLCDVFEMRLVELCGLTLS